MDISKIDANFAVNKVDENGLVYHNCLEESFRVYGLLLPDAEYPYFRRMPQKVAESVSANVERLAKNSAGGRVRFQTNSKRIAIRCKLKSIYRANHFTLLGSAGFDLYCGTTFAGSFRPPYDIEDGYSSELVLNDQSMKEITINFPLYSTVAELEIGLEEGADILPPTPYSNEVPVVYYGSSITQGACASRPGCSYQNMISRTLNCDYWNLGFSGSAKAEPAIAEYISKLPMSVFVFDYDHNAPNLAYLQETHERMFKTVREANPDLPIIMISRPSVYANKKAVIARRDAIMNTYLNAKNNGDNNVYFLDGSKMLSIFGGDSGTVDGTHPNDLGFACMAKVIGEMLALILESLQTK